MPPPIFEFRPEAPEALIDLIDRMLEKDRDQRIQSIRQVGAELEAIIKGLDISPLYGLPVGAVGSEAPTEAVEPGPTRVAPKAADQTATEPSEETKPRNLLWRVLLDRSKSDTAEMRRQRLQPWQRFLVGFIRTLVIIAIVIAILGVLLLGGTSLVFARLAENGIKNNPWEFNEAQVFRSEQETSREATDELQMFLPGMFDEIDVDFAPPDQVVASIITPENKTVRVSGRITVNSKGHPVVVFERIGRVPLWLFGSIVSGGVNRGFADVFEAADAQIDELEITESTISIIYADGGR